MIPNVTRDDAGTYVCTAKNAFGNASATVNAAVEYATAIINASRDQNAIEGDPLTPICDVDGYPVPSVVWSKTPDSVQLPATSPQYRVSAVRSAVARIYTCFASNEMGNASASMKVVVYYVSVIDMNFTSLYTASWYGHIVTLRCRARSKPTPHITWYGTTGNQTLCRVMGTEGESTLTFTSRDEWEYGAYKCRAINHVGHVETNITVTKFTRLRCSGRRIL
ncbi:limbic system-associated membrane protein [Nematostella vectensis]|uniref:limbic system-associated membrane protein n=1 Tax=Nematostella vectensis TaxID=45351 RepID=UPI0020774498|nr:limbic system-associated membrane protein [Nematostella vectensis]